MNIQIEFSRERNFKVLEIGRENEKVKNINLLNFQVTGVRSSKAFTVFHIFTHLKKKENDPGGRKRQDVFIGCVSGSLLPCVNMSSFNAHTVLMKCVLLAMLMRKSRPRGYVGYAEGNH